MIIKYMSQNNHNLLTLNKIKKFLTKDVMDPTKYPIPENANYTRTNFNNYSEDDWNYYFYALKTLYFCLIQNPELLKTPSQINSSLKPSHKKSPLKIYRANNKTFFHKKTLLPQKMEGDSQPMWFAINEKDTLVYHISRMKKYSTTKTDKVGQILCYTLKDETESGKQICLLDFTGNTIEHCKDENLSSLNMVLITSMYHLLDLQIATNNKQILAAYGNLPEKFGTRSSFYIEDRIVVREFCIIMKLLNLMYDDKKQIIGYYHSQVSHLNDAWCIPFYAEVAIDSDYLVQDANYIFEKTVEKIVYNNKSKIFQSVQAEIRKKSKKRKRLEERFRNMKELTQVQILDQDSDSDSGSDWDKSPVIKSTPAEIKTVSKKRKNIQVQSPGLDYVSVTGLYDWDQGLQIPDFQDQAFQDLDFQEILDSLSMQDIKNTPPVEEFQSKYPKTNSTSKRQKLGGRHRKTQRRVLRKHKTQKRRNRKTLKRSFVRV